MISIVDKIRNDKLHSVALCSVNVYRNHTVVQSSIKESTVWCRRVRTPTRKNSLHHSCRNTPPS